MVDRGKMLKSWHQADIFSEYLELSLKQYHDEFL